MDRIRARKLRASPNPRSRNSIVASAARVTDRLSGDTDLYSVLIWAREGADSWSVCGGETGVALAGA